MVSRASETAKDGARLVLGVVLVMMATAALVVMVVRAAPDL